MSSKIFEFDILRLFAIICIILTHIRFFCNSEFFKLHSDFFTTCGLITFFFISGFLIRYHNTINSKEEVVSFLKKRAKRIYPLYWISILSTYIMYEILHFHKIALPYDLSFLSLIVNIIGMQIFLPQSLVQNHTFLIPGMWFIGSILLYYSIYSVVSYYSKNLISLIIYSGIAIFPFILLRYEFGVTQSRVFYYYPAFIIGVFTCIILKSYNLKKIIYFSISTNIIVFIFILLIYVANLYNILPISVGNSGTIGIYTISFFVMISIGIILLKKRIYKPISNTKNLKLISKAAQGSFCVYLFHFQILTVLQTIMDILQIDNSKKTLILLIFGIPTLFIIGYYIQKKYNYLEYKLKNKFQNRCSKSISTR